MKLLDTLGHFTHLPRRSKSADCYAHQKPIELGFADYPTQNFERNASLWLHSMPDFGYSSRLQLRHANGWSGTDVLRAD